MLNNYVWLLSIIIEYSCVVWRTVYCWYWSYYLLLGSGRYIMLTLSVVQWNVWVLLLIPLTGLLLLLSSSSSLSPANVHSRSSVTTAIASKALRICLLQATAIYAFILMSISHITSNEFMNRFKFNSSKYHYLCFLSYLQCFALFSTFASPPFLRAHLIHFSYRYAVRISSFIHI